MNVKNECDLREWAMYRSQVKFGVVYGDRSNTHTHTPHDSTKWNRSMHSQNEKHSMNFMWNTIQLMENSSNSFELFGSVFFFSLLFLYRALFAPFVIVLKRHTNKNYKSHGWIATKKNIKMPKQNNSKRNITLWRQTQSKQINNK